MPSPFHQLFADLSKELRALDEQGLLRQVVSLEAVEGPRVRIDGRERVNWCSNDFLGLSQHPALIQAAAAAMASWGTGARAARLLSGTTEWHVRLERALAAWFGAEAAIVFSSGYLANLGTLGALLSSTDAVFIDRLCHASLFDAVRATGATLRIMRHNDPDHLKILLSRALWERDMWAPAIRPPTVPEGTARLRLGVTALHTEAHVDELVNALRQALDGGEAAPFSVTGARSARTA